MVWGPFNNHITLGEGRGHVERDSLCQGGEAVNVYAYFTYAPAELYLLHMVPMQLGPITVKGNHGRVQSRFAETLNLTLTQNPNP